MAIPNFAVYAATKAYVTNFSDALRSELLGTGVRVTALCPGPVQTEFSEVAHRSPNQGMLAPTLTHVPVAEVVATALHGLERNRPIVIPGAIMNFAMAIVRPMPRALLRFARKIRSKNRPNERI